MVRHVCNDCEDVRDDNSCGCAEEPVRVVKVGFDIGGVLSKYPDLLRPIIEALSVAPNVEVHVLSDMQPHAKCVDWVVHRNGFAIPPERIHACDYDAHGESCKAVKAREIGLDVLVDDHLGYVATVGAPALRLLAMPDPTRPYYHDNWKTDGSEGTFGRRRPPAAATTEEP